MYSRLLHFITPLIPINDTVVDIPIPPPLPVQPRQPHHKPLNHVVCLGLTTGVSTFYGFSNINCWPGGLISWPGGPVSWPGGPMFWRQIIAVVPRDLS